VDSAVTIKRSMVILLSGASGFIGSRLSRSLRADGGGGGHRVVALTRRAGDGDSVWWDAAAGRIDVDALARLRPDVVINLAGENIAQRWTPRRRARIRDSRVNGTRALAEALASLAARPRVLVSGSAVGYYGAHRGDEVLDETSAPGVDFLGQVAREWERSTDAASAAGIRVVLIRTGVVLGAGGGVLGRVALPFRAGLGGRLGDGRQWMSWIAMDDVVRGIRHLAEASTLSGPVNLVAPEPVTNAQFTKILAHVLSRPALFPVPRVALELLFGTMADNTILASQRAVPKRIAGDGFAFRHPLLEDALRSELRR